MNTEEKARAYDEALKRAKTTIDVAADKDLVGGVVRTIFPELRESEDERIRKELKEAFEAYDIESKWNGIPIRSIFAWLEKQKERKTAEWSEEDEEMLNSCISSIEEAKENRYAYKETDGDTSYDHEIAWLKSLRPQPKGDVYKEKNEAFKLGKQQLAIGFMNYLDDNRPKSKMISNGEYADIDKAFKENNWKKIMGYADKYLPYVPSWKPSEEQMEALNEVAYNLVGTGTDTDVHLAQLYEQLKKLM